jgi:AraC family transcriptional regulator
MLQLESGRYLGLNKRSWNAKGVYVSETEYHSKVFEGWHYHENSHITFILQGGNREQRNAREFQAVPGSIAFYPSGELHRNLNTKHPSRNVNVEIQHDFSSHYNLNMNAFNATTANCAGAKFTLLKVYRECLTNDEHSSTSIHQLLLNFIDATSSTKKGIYNPQWARLIIETINDRWNENISLDELAKLVQVHPVTISKFFPKYYQCTHGEYVRKLRIEKATALIRTSQLSLTEIAHQCGFFDQSHFIRIFKQTTGFLPGRYKNL